MSILAKRIFNIQPSPTVAITAIANEMKANGKDVIGLGAGEPDFDTPKHIVDAAEKAMRSGKTRYVSPAGILELRKAIVEKFKKDNNLNYTVEQINVGCGGKQTIFNLFAATVEKDDEIIIPSPYWVSYPDIAALFDGKPIMVNCEIENKFKMTAEQLENAITPKTKWLILNSPSNPTGAGYTVEDLKELGEVLKKHPHVYIMTDDMYEFLVYDDYQFATIAEVVPELFDRTMTLNGLSKAYCMTGWRVGYAAGPIDIIKKMNMLNSQSTTSTSTISQWAAYAALTGDHSFIAKHNESFVERRNFVVKELNKIDGVECLTPNGAFYVYPSIKKLINKTTPNGKIIKNDADFAAYLLEDHEVAVVHGEAFGLSPYFRISYATSMENLEKALKRIQNACKILK